MAIDQSQLLQMLLQSGGGGIAISPTSGLQDPSLSGLALGPQGMGLGGGESLMGGGPRGFGGVGEGGLGGLDLFQLLAQLQAAPGVTGAGLTSGIGARSLGGGFGAGPEGGFGSGGPLGPGPSMGSMPTASQQGQAGLGAAGTAAQFLSLLREGTGFGKALTQLFPKGAQASQVSDINSILAEMGISGTPFVPTPSVVSGASGGSVPSLPFDASQTIPFQIDPAILSGASGGGLVAGGAPLTSAELSARLGAQGLGDIPSIGAPTGLLESLGGLQGALGGAGVLTNLGFGALNLAQGNTGAGLGELLGTGGGLALGAALAPETAGLSLLLGGIGGGAGGLFGGLFGGGGPSQDWISFPSRVVQGWQDYGTHLQTAWDAVAGARTISDLNRAMATYQSAVQGQPGFPWGTSSMNISGTPYSTWPLGGVIQSQSGTQAHGVALPQNQLGTAENRFWNLVSNQYQRFFQQLSPEQQRVAAQEAQQTSAPLPNLPPADVGLSWINVPDLSNFQPSNA